MTPLDVCSVEAAVEADEDGGASRDVLSGGEDWKLGRGGYPVRRQVYVFLWGSSMGPGDVWGRWVTRLPKVTVNLLDVPRVRRQGLGERQEGVRGRVRDRRDWV